MLRRALLLLCVALLGSATAYISAREYPNVGEIGLDDLPPQALVTLQQIDRGGPFSYRRDGIVFKNREGRLPGHGSGYYREYTVPTPYTGNRGARRIITGGQPPAVFYYTNDHYRSFARIRRDP